MRLSHVFLWIMVAGIGLALVAALLDAATRWSFIFLTGVAPTLLIIAAAAVPAAACARVAERGRLPLLMWSGCLASGLAAMLWISLVYGVGGYELAPNLARTASVPTIWTVALMIVGLLALPHLGLTAARIIRAATIVLVILVSIQAALWVWLTPIYESRGWRASNDFHILMIRVLSVLGIPALCGIASTYLLAHTRRLTGEEIPEHERLPFSIVCPRCSQRTELRTGGDACRSCGLRVRVTPA